MKSIILKEEALQRKIQIIVDASEVQSEFSEFYIQVQKNADIKGFRKGKAPVNKLKSMYKVQAAEEVSRNLVSRFYYEALTEHSLNPIGQPHFHFEKVEEDKGFEFSVELEIRPTVEVKGYEGLEVAREKLDVTEKSVDDVVEKIRQGSAVKAPVLEDRGAQIGDISEINFEGFLDSVPFDGGRGEDHELELGSKSFIEGFEEGIIGMKINDKKDLNLVFPKEYNHSHLAGKDVVFKVELKKLSKKIPPELNDEFIKSLGQQYSSVKAFKEGLRKDIEARESHRVQEELKDRLLNALVAKNELEIPESLYKEQKKRLIEDAKERLKKEGMPDKDFEAYRAKWDSDFSSSAKFIIQSTFLIDELAKKYKLFAQEKDIQSQIKAHSEQTGVPLAEIEKFYEEKEGEKKSNLSFKITQDKVLDFLVSKAKITEASAEKIKKNEQAIKAKV